MEGISTYPPTSFYTLHNPIWSLLISIQRVSLNVTRVSDKFYNLLGMIPKSYMDSIFITSLVTTEFLRYIIVERYDFNLHEGKTCTITMQVFSKSSSIS